jgi:hypothetical protein
LVAWIAAGGVAPILVAIALGRLLTRGSEFPGVIRFAIGAAAESLGIFFLLWAGIGNAAVLGFLGALSLAGLRGWRPSLELPSGWLWRALFSAYAGLYLVHALAPEIQPDGITYHLGLTREYARTAGLSGHISFFEMLPQGLEMLFVPAYRIGGHSAAKLISFAFTIALLPVFVLIGRQLELDDRVTAWAGLVFVTAPVTGVTGTSSYNDTALVFFTLAAVWALREKHFAVGGLLAGFCYAVKINAILVTFAAGLWVLWTSRRQIARFAAGVAAAVLPWMARNWIVAGNPVAPLGNRWFPNAYFHQTMESSLAQSWSAAQVPWWRMPWELTCGGALDGIYGPAFLLTPLALLALAKKQTRWCVAAAAVFAIPFLLNHGARFLMIPAAFVSLALVSVLPVRLMAAAGVFAAVLCWPAVIPYYARAHAWQLEGFPIRAALRLEPEREYLKRIWEPGVAFMLDELVPANARVFALMDVARAYTDRRVVELWQSGEGERLTDAIRVASQYAGDPLFDQRANWPAQSLMALRYRLADPGRSPPGMEWCVHEIRLFLEETRIYNSPRWTLASWPARFETPYAFDGNLVSRWRTWEPMKAGMFLEARFDRPYRLTGAEMTSHTPVFGVRTELYGMGEDGRWRLLSKALPAVRRPHEELRLTAARFLKREGIDYLLVPERETGGWQLARFFVDQHAAWGMEEVNRHGFIRLYRLR